MSTIWHRKATNRPYTVWQGTEWSARGLSYRWKWRAVVAAWWASLYSRQDVWIEREQRVVQAYRAEMFDADGLSLGFTESGQ